MESLEARISALTERVGAVKATADAAHLRMDGLNLQMREDLKLIYQEMKEISEWMHRSRGWAAAGTLFAGGIGGAIAAIMGMFFK